MTLSRATTVVRSATIGKAQTLALSRDFGEGDSEPRAVDIGPPSSAAFDAGARYAARRILGEGGMGEVRLSHDGFIGRDVAMKVIRTSHGSMSDARARFLREARVQGQLEHPAIVPVYDLGVTAEGEIFFTMKRIVGLTVEEIIDGVRKGDASIIAKFPRRKILTAMSQVSLAVAFAHTKGVVHRDLKPANIMLGDFGEVYVLDWGVAKIVDAEEIEPSEPVSRRGSTGSIRPPDAETIEETQAGALLGTPGYMSPEQARGEASECDGRADVYALGTVLHEALVLEPVHRGKQLAEIIVSTSRLDGARPSAHDPSLPQALDEICHRATRLDRADRFKTARELHDAIECFLDGERDRERQVALADEHTDRAETLRIEESKGGADVEARRTEVMRELGAALALDPSHQRARRVLLDVLLHEPDTIPPAAEKELDETNRRDRAKSSLVAAFSYMSWYAISPVLFWMGIRDMGWLVVLDAAVLGLVVYLLWMARSGNAHPAYMRIAIWWNFVIASLLSVFFGPLIIVPQAATSISASFMVNLRANRQTRLYISAAAVGAVTIPIVLGLLGVVPNPYSFQDGAIVVHPLAVDYKPVPTLVFLLITTAFSLVVPAKLIGRGVEILISSERKTFARAHRLRQLIPTGDAARSERTPKSPA